ncbi:hypothetical protein [Kaistia sp. MMO-174]|uniref:hypothetical protein n=1 Tax=Kaistia sp. MMO-174 TaxID=3081256 RepID=UPI003015C23D
MIDNRTANREYLLPDAANKMRSEDLPRLIASLLAIDADVAALFAGLTGKASSVHTHEMADIVGLVLALAGKAALIHTHSIGSLTGLDFTGATAGQFVRYNGTIWVPAAIASADLPNKGVTNAKLRDSDPLTVIGRASASLGTPGDISATANDRMLARVADALAFVQMTLGMIPDGLITFAKLATADAIARLNTEGQTVAGGAKVTPKNLGNLSGASLAVNYSARSLQYCSNNGAGSLVLGSEEGTTVLHTTNVTGAGAITMSGVTIHDASDAFDTTVGSEFVTSFVTRGTRKVAFNFKVA